ncbi:hypothetical protein EON64_12335 [archaeon]|nr:MAG: hypothetical protein EON64_12335 [archaeon]
MERLVEGRARVIAMVKLCYGQSSVVMVRAYIDLANAYALQGQWQQAEEHIMTALEKLVQIEAVSKQSANTQHSRKLALSAARRICVVFSCLRKHVVNNCGQIKASFVKELLHDMGDIMASTDTVDTHALPHPSKLFQSLSTFFSTPSSKLPLKQLTQSYFAEVRSSNSNNKTEIKTWGEIVEFFRTKCDVMKQYVDCAYTLLLPQTKALLTLPFRLCDPQTRNLAHPVQLANAIQHFPSTLKAISNVKLHKLLAACRVEVPLLVNAHTGSVQTLPQPNVPQQGVFYELPMTFEEYICIYIVACSENIDGMYGMLRAQVLTIKGVCSLHLQRLEVAEDVLLKALQELENVGLEGELMACELYNSIAQLMITKHHQWLDGKKTRLHAEAETWVIEEEQGRKTVRMMLRAIKSQYDYKSNIISVAEMELMARKQAIQKRTRDLFDSDESESTKPSLEAAYRYLVKSFEIVEGVHGVHAIVGTACVAVASVQNLLRDYENTRDWLLRAIRVFEKCSPIPMRAITFAQTQLANALSRMKHEDEGRKVLNKAAQFHLQQARSMLTLHLAKKSVPSHADDMESDMVPSYFKRQVKLIEQLWPVILKGSPLFDEIQTALTLLIQVSLRTHTHAHAHIKPCTLYLCAGDEDVE